jgi:hypothetical protein
VALGVPCQLIPYGLLSDLVRLPGLPLILWSDKIVNEIDNALNLFYEVHNSYKNKGYMGMVRLLVGLDLTKGMTNSIIIRKDLSIFHQPLEYEGFPFKCGRCHIYEHLAKEFPLPNKRKFGFKGSHKSERTPLSV